MQLAGIDWVIINAFFVAIIMIGLIVSRPAYRVVDMGVVNWAKMFSGNNNARGFLSLGIVNIANFLKIILA